MDIRALLPGKRAALNVGATNAYLEANQPAEITGTLEFKDGKGRQHSKRIRVSAEHLRGGLVHAEEMAQTLEKLQKLPDALSAVTRAINQVRDEIASLRPARAGMARTFRRR